MPSLPSLCQKISMCCSLGLVKTTLDDTKYLGRCDETRDFWDGKIIPGYLDGPSTAITGVLVREEGGDFRQTRKRRKWCKDWAEGLLRMLRCWAWRWKERVWTQESKKCSSRTWTLQGGAVLPVRVLFQSGQTDSEHLNSKTEREQMCAVFS